MEDWKVGDSFPVDSGSSKPRKRIARRGPPDQEKLAQRVFVGFNSRVIALDRDTGQLIWSWKSPKGASQFVSVMLDGDRVMVAINGYMYCLDPMTGREIWCNPLKGMGLGVPSLASVRGNSLSAAAAAAIIAAQQGAA